jgi:hypothetical protein
MRFGLFFSWDVLYLGILYVVMFCIWDVLRLGRLFPGCFVGVPYICCFCHELA